MGIKFAVCEDEKEQRELLSRYIERLCKEMNEEAEISCFANSEALLANFPPDTDILFLDIMMGQINGVEAAKKLRKQGRDVCIIFITSMVQFAVEGYRVRAFSFLTKPLDYEEFRIEASAAVKNIQKNRGKEITVKNYQNVKRISSKDILYGEVQNHRIILHTTGGDVAYQGKMGDLEEELSGCGFFRCHVAYLVSLSHVDSVEGNDAVAANGDRIPISRGRKKEFLQAMAAYLGGSI